MRLAGGYEVNEKFGIININGPPLQESISARNLHKYNHLGLNSLLVSTDNRHSTLRSNVVLKVSYT